MKVLLIRPTFTGRLPKKQTRPDLYEPLGLAYLAAAAREAGHEPVVLDCMAEGWWVRREDGDLVRVGMPDEEIAARLHDEAPDLVGITCQFTGFDRDTLRIAALVKATLGDVPVVVGGPDASERSEALIEDPNIDLIVRSEGESVLTALLARLEADKALPEDLPGTTSKAAVNPLADLIEDLDGLPLPARDLLPMDVYLEDQRPLMPFAKRWPIGFLISSRGCPYDCVFCSTKRFWRTWRPRAPERVVDEIEYMVETFGVREIAFQDDSFLAQPKRVMALCEDLIQQDIDVTWTVPPGLSIWRVNEELLEAMRASGFYRACFPIESGDPEILRFIRKKVDLDRVLETVELCHRLGIWTYGNFIIGFPEETPESVEKTAQFAVDSGLDMISLYIAQPYAGSDLYKVYKSLGLLDVPHAEASTIFHTAYHTKHFTADELNAKRQEIYWRFIRKRVARCFTPKGIGEIRRKMATAEDFAYAARIVGVMVKNSLKAGKVSLFG